jgi:cytochrome bd-type quinol oxidase subunit 1
MDNLAAARSQMGISLAFHIICAVIGVALPLMMTKGSSRSFKRRHTLKNRRRPVQPLP